MNLIVKQRCCYSTNKYQIVIALELYDYDCGKESVEE